MYDIKNYQYINAEMAFIDFIYEIALGNAHTERRIHQAGYPRNISSGSTYSNILIFTLDFVKLAVLIRQLIS